MKREDIIDEAAENILAKLPTPWLMLDIVKKYPVMYEQSLNTVLQQECIRYNKLLAVMKQTLSDVRKALKGLVVMSSELDEMFTALQFQKVPTLWAKVSYLSLQPLGSWYKDLIARIEFMDKWITQGPPDSFWMSAFFFPQGYMTAAVQTYARENDMTYFQP